MSQIYMVKEIAAFMRVSPSTVVNWIESKRLIAMDVRRKGSKKAAYRITQEDFDEFRGLSRTEDKKPKKNSKRSMRSELVKKATKFI